MARTDHFGATDKLLLGIIQNNINNDAFLWLEAAAEASALAKLGQAFVMLPRKTGKSTLTLNETQADALKQAGMAELSSWTVDRLARVWLLGAQSFADAGKAHPIIENLFLSAEMNEAVALYSALPFLAEPESWVKRCAEGIRSNIGSVLEAIMEHNPYPSAYLSEAAWNQLVLKAFFTEKNISKIHGLELRANEALALTLNDYACERYAAGRTVNPQLWHLTAPFMNDKIFEAIKIGLQKDDAAGQEALALAISTSAYEPAKAYLKAISE